MYKVSSRVTGMILFFAFFLFVFSHSAQEHYRVKANFSLKEKKADGKSMLTMGTVYYDKKSKQIVYNVSFPGKETWVARKKEVTLFVNDTVQRTDKNETPVTKTMLHLALSNTLLDYGLKRTLYKLSVRKKEDSSEISTWLPRKKSDKFYGMIILSAHDHKLNGIAFYNNKLELVKKYIYQDYFILGTFAIPQKVIEISIDPADKSENYSQTTYSEILIDSKGEDNFYNYGRK